jgi:alcohol dehydrogenase, propanol-preferring
VPESFAYELPVDFDDVHGAPLLCAGLIGYRGLERAEVPDGGRLLLVGFGSSAHIVLQLATYRGHEVFVVTRSENHVRQARELGAAWSGSDFGDLPHRVQSAILFAPAGGLVPPTLSALERGGTLSIPGIHLSDIPGLDYETQLFHEKQIRSVEANTREDGRRFLAEAVEAGVRPHVMEYGLEDTNRALQDLKHSRIDGTGVVAVG